jgi:hypothetical protein
MRTLSKQVQDLDAIDLDRRGFYFMVSATEDEEGELDLGQLLFIGAAYKEDLRERIPDRKLFKAYRNVMAEARDADLYLAFAYIAQTERGFMPQKIHSDIQCALIYQNQPVCNSFCREAYHSEEGNKLYIINTGDFDPLEEICQVPGEGESPYDPSKISPEGAEAHDEEGESDAQSVE